MVILHLVMENLYNSPNLKKQSTQALLAVAFFIVSYLVLLAAAIGLAILCGYAAILLFSLKFTYVTLMVGIGVFSIGILILYFLLKFIFKTSKTDLSSLTEITREEEPKLFALIDEIVSEVQTQKPKHVYLSAEINAYVFYDSSFWSMFLPIRKNLTIGVGLMNAVTQQELKAILAHEFGHFSQKSMKVGSYVYNVNKVIHNMLFDNNSYNDTIAVWANLSAFFAFFTNIAIKIVQGIQYLLMKLYELVNLQFYALSREMEFHADAVAASVAGSQALVDSLRRLNLADAAHSETMQFYYGKLKEGIAADNIYQHQQKVLHAMASDFKLPMVNQLPLVDEHFENKFPKSRLEFNKQWMSHPEIEERAKRLLSYNQEAKNPMNGMALDLLKDPEATQKTFTLQSFSFLETGAKSTLSAAEFEAVYQAEKHKNNLPEIFNNYFDYHPFPTLPYAEMISALEAVPLHDLSHWCSDENKGKLVDHNNTRNDQSTLEWLINPDNNPSIKTFDYAGVRYKLKDAAEVLELVNQHLEQLEKQIKDIDMGIMKYLYQSAKNQDALAAFEQLYESHIAGFNAFTDTDALVQTAFQKLDFVTQQTPFAIITENFEAFKPTELLLKEKMNALFANEKQKSLLTEEQEKAMFHYKDRDLVYFENEAYNQVALDMMYDAINHYQAAFNYIWFYERKELLTNFLEIGKI